MLFRSQKRADKLQNEAGQEGSDDKTHAQSADPPAGGSYDIKERVQKIKQQASDCQSADQINNAQCNTTFLGFVQPGPLFFFQTAFDNSANGFFGIVVLFRQQSNV